MSQAEIKARQAIARINEKRRNNSAIFDELIGMYYAGAEQNRKPAAWLYIGRIKNALEFTRLEERFRVAYSKEIPLYDLGLTVKEDNAP